MTHNGTFAATSTPQSGINGAPRRARRVLIVDDHPIVRQGLRRVMQDEHDLIVCGDTGTASEANAAILELNPDVLICDINQKHTDGIELIRYVRAHHPQLRILVLSTQDESIYAERMLALGANGYITKHATADEVLASLRRVLDGNIYVSQAVGSNMIHKYAAAGSYGSADPMDRLSSRELQVLNLIGEGVSTREAANSLNLSIKTVESHRQRIKRKLNLTTATQLVRYAVLGLSRRNASNKL